MINRNDMINILFGVVGLVGVGYAIGTHTKMAKVSGKLDKSIDELANGMEIDIPEEIVNKAVDKAINSEAKRAVEQATKETIINFKNDIHAQVHSAVDAEYDRIKDSVLSEISAEAAKIDISRVRRDVERMAKEAALKKFDDNLDDILEKFNNNLDNTSRIYSSIREAITKTPDSGKEFVVRLN